MRGQSQAKRVKEQKLKMRRNLGLCVVICLSGLVVGKDLADQEREGKG